MKFSLFAPFLALSSAVMAAPAADAQLAERDVLALAAPQLSAETANNMVEALYTELEPMMANINKTVSHYKAGSVGKAAAIKSVGAEMQAITVALNSATSKIATAANGKSLKAREVDAGAAKNPLQSLANNLAKTLTALAGTVNTALAVLGLTGLLSFLTPLTGSLSGIVLMLITVVNPLLAVLKVLLDGVLLGVSGLLAGLIL